jgi:DEAD_2
MKHTTSWRNMSHVACRDTREALGLELHNAVVIIDEAHNLLPAINGSHSIALPSASLATIAALLGSYLSHFQSRLGGAKTQAVTAAKRLAERLQAFVGSCAAQVRCASPQSHNLCAAVVTWCLARARMKAAGSLLNCMLLRRSRHLLA